MIFVAMNDLLHFSIAQKALKKLYPNWQLFIDEVMDLLQPFWLGTQSKESVHFIHLVGYGKRQKAREILTDLLELLDWQSESIFLCENWDLNAPSALNQTVRFQEVLLVFPRVVLTDYLSDFFAGAPFADGRCSDFARIETFLKERKELRLSEDYRPSNARGRLVISFLDLFGDCDFIRTRLMFQFLWSKPMNSAADLRKNFLPEDLQKLIEKEYFSKDELVFFSNDKPAHILLAVKLQKVTQMLEQKGSDLLGIPVRLTFSSMDYFLAHIFYKRLSNPQLHRAALDFFIPVFRQYPRMSEKVEPSRSQVQLDFKGSWKFDLITE
jgi:hypothetical protein